MSEALTRWDAADYLQTPEDIRLYLEACAEEDPGDGSLLRAALHDIARAGNMSRLVRETGLSRKELYKALSEDGDPTLATVMRITRALGMKVRIRKPIEPTLPDGCPMLFDRNRRNPRNGRSYVVRAGD